MLLRGLRVENFRGVESASLDFDETTILIGENDAGRTSLLDALDLVLGDRSQDAPFVIEPSHFYRPEGWTPAASRKPIRIVVEFAERSPGEWSGKPFAPLPLEPPLSSEACRRLWLEVAIRELPGGDAQATWAFRNRANGPLLAAGDRTALDAVRSLNPVIWLRAGVLTRSAPGRPAPQSGIGLPAQAELAEEVDSQYQRILAGTTGNPLHTIELGYRAAQSLLDGIPKAFRKSRASLGSVLQEISGRGVERTVPNRQSAARGAAAQQLGVFLLMGAVVRSMRRPGSQEGAAPILVVEDPEAHLHPMTVATVWSVLEEIGLQKVIASHSGTLLASAQIGSLRRLVRRGGAIEQYRIPTGGLSRDDLRRLTYHLRSRRSVATFARCLLLVEGETEFWILPELARICGYNFAAEGITCVEFAQCGLAPLVRFARHMGIGWHLLTDGDDAGRIYRAKAERLLDGDPAAMHITQLADHDIEHCFWSHGYAEVYTRAAYGSARPGGPAKARQTIHKAIDKHSKPQMAVRVLEAVSSKGPIGVPAPLRRAIDIAVKLARGR